MNYYEKNEMKWEAAEIVRSDSPNLKRLEELFKKGISVDECVNGDDTLLIESIKYSTINMVNFLLEKGADINKRGQFDLAPINIAVQEKKFNICKLLLDKGCDTQCRFPQNMNLVTRSLFTRDLKLINLLLKYGLKPDDNFYYRGYNWTPIAYFSIDGDTEIVELLKQAGAR